MPNLDRDLGADLRVLDAMALRARVALHNLANQDTPGFKRYEVRFEDLLRQTERQRGARSEVLPEVERVETGPPDANNVDSSDELLTLMKARLSQQLYLRRVSGHFSRLRMAIGSGSGG